MEQQKIAQYFDVREFQYLVRIAECRNITKAAEELYLTQSALSRFLQTKEKKIGALLFHRMGRRLVPTYLGEICIESAKRILEISRKMEDDLEAATKRQRGRIRLAFHGSWSEFFFMNIYPEFQNKYPDIELQTYEVGTTKAMEMLDQGAVDLAVMTTAWRDHAHFAREVLNRQRMVLVVRDDHPLLAGTQGARPTVKLSCIQDEPMILRHEDERTREYTDHLFREYALSPRVVLETASRDNALRAVVHGVGVTFALDDPILLIMNPRIRYLYYEDSQTAITTSVIYHREKKFSRPEEDLRTMITIQYQRAKEKSIELCSS